MAPVTFHLCLAKQQKAAGLQHDNLNLSLRLQEAACLPSHQADQDRDGTS